MLCHIKLFVVSDYIDSGKIVEGMVEEDEQKMNRTLTK